MVHHTESDVPQPPVTTSLYSFLPHQHVRHAAVQKAIRGILEGPEEKTPLRHGSLSHFGGFLIRRGRNFTGALHSLVVKPGGGREASQSPPTGCPKVRGNF